MAVELTLEDQIKKKQQEDADAQIAHQEAAGGGVPVTPLGVAGASRPRRGERTRPSLCRVEFTRDGDTQTVAYRLLRTARCDFEIPKGLEVDQTHLSAQRDGTAMRRPSDGSLKMSRRIGQRAAKTTSQRTGWPLRPNTPTVFGFVPCAENTVGYEP